MDLVTGRVVVSRFYLQVENDMVFDETVNHVINMGTMLEAMETTLRLLSIARIAARLRLWHWLQARDPRGVLRQNY